MPHELIRVLHMIASLNIGGSQAMVMNIYRSIDREKVQFGFIIDHPEETELKDEIESMGGKVFILPTFIGKNIREVKKAWNDFFTEHTEYKILHTHSRSYASIYLPIAKKHGLITIAHSHSTSNGTGIKAKIKDLMQIPIRYQADYLFACSQEAGRWLFGNRVIKSNRFMIVPNGINIKSFEFDADTRNRIRKLLGITNEIVIGHVGRFHEAKNHEYLIEIFHNLSKNANIRLLLVGNGNTLGKIQDLVKKYCIEDKVIFSGSVLNVADYYQAMDFFVFPSKWEGIPLSVVEAQANGLECLISDRITKDVILTDLVTALPIEKPAEYWAEYIRKKLPTYRKEITSSEYKQICLYDSIDIAKRIMDFYMSIFETV